MPPALFPWQRFEERLAHRTPNGIASNKPALDLRFLIQHRIQRRLIQRATAKTGRQTQQNQPRNTGSSGSTSWRGPHHRILLLKKNPLFKIVSIDPQLITQLTESTLILITR